MSFKILQGDCLNLLKDFSDNSIDSIVTDPPAGISFMSKDWDTDKGGRDNWIKWMQEIAVECKRVLKPGGHALVWTIPRTSHWTTTAWENAGFQIRDVIAHVFGSGFPKSLNIGKAVDKLQGSERVVVDTRDVGHDITNGGFKDAKPERKIMPVTKGYSIWEGWGTALKPAREDWILMRKPLENGLTIAENVLKWGTGGINIDECRIKTNDTYSYPNGAGGNGFHGGVGRSPDGSRTDTPEMNLNGRFPANFIHDGSSSVLKNFPVTKSGTGAIRTKEGKFLEHGGLGSAGDVMVSYPDTVGSAARFFYCAKPSKCERNGGLDGFVEKQSVGGGGVTSPVDELGHVNVLGNKGCAVKFGSAKALSSNFHPTVKPIALMQYLCRLITPVGGVVLDPFMGSGSTGCGAVLEGFAFIGMDLQSDYCEISLARIAYFAKLSTEDGSVDLKKVEEDSHCFSDVSVSVKPQSVSLQLSLFEVMCANKEN